MKLLKTLIENINHQKSENAKEFLFINDNSLNYRLLYSDVLEKEASRLGNIKTEEKKHWAEQYGVKYILAHVHKGARGKIYATYNKRRHPVSYVSGRFGVLNLRKDV